MKPAALALLATLWLLLLAMFNVIDLRDELHALGLDR